MPQGWGVDSVEVEGGSAFIPGPGEALWPLHSEPQGAGEQGVVSEWKLDRHTLPLAKGDPCHGPCP